MRGSGFREMRKFVAPEILLGMGARHLAGRYARNMGAERVMVVSDPGVVAAGWTAEVMRDLAAAGLASELYVEVNPNPRAAQVMEGAVRFTQAKCNALVAVGGGSPMDCAKGIGIVTTNGGDILAYEGVDRIPSPIPPLICVPTTGGTSADVSQFAIITDPQRRAKIAILSKAIVPDAALVDPETLVTMDPDLSAHTAFDALTHAVEAYVSNAQSSLTDLMALEAIRLLSTHLLPSREDPTDPERRGPIMLASLQAGLAFSNASLGIVHAMAHSLGGLLDLPHGLCNAILLGPGMAFNFSTAPERYRAIAQAMGLASRPDSELLPALQGEIDRLREGCGIRQSLGQLGVRAEDLPFLAARAMHDTCLATNPRQPTQSEIEHLYATAL